MEFRLSIKELQNEIIEFDSQHDMGDVEFYKELRYDFNSPPIKGQYNEVVLEDIRIGYGNSTLGTATRLDFEFYGETIEMHFTLNGRSLTTIDGYPNNLEINSGYHNIFYGKDIAGNLLWKSHEMFVFEVNFNPQLFSNYLPESRIFETFKKNIQAENTCWLNAINHPIQPKMYTIIHHIINCNRKGIFKKLFLEAKVMELLLLQLEQIQQNTLISNNTTSKDNIEKMQYAKEIILQHLDNPLTLYDLSKKINTNECDLKRTFKAVFGQTVFGYIQELKMNQAKVLIQDHKLPVYQVADMVGYKNPQHFTVAFKKHFGYVPSKLMM